MAAEGANSRLAAVSADTVGAESEGHLRLGMFLAGLAAIGLVPTFVLVAPASTFTPIALFLPLAAIGGIAALSSVAARRDFVIDAGLAIDIVALVLLGPLPAFAIAAGTNLVLWSFERYRLVALLANIASYGWSVIAGALMIAALTGGWPPKLGSVSEYFALTVAGVALGVFGTFITRAIVASIADGRRLAQVVRGELVPVIPGYLLVAALGVATIFLYTQIGILALGIFAAITLVPQLLLPILLRPRPVEELSHADAVVLYSKAIASVMKLDSTTKEILSDAAHHIEGPEAQANGGKIKASYSGEHFHDVVEAVLYYREHWDASGGFPGGVGGEMIPLTSRVLAVADNWAQLTASGVWTVTHAQAIAKLKEHAGVEYDPRIVAAAARVVEEERMGLTDNQPQLHEVPLPQLVRKIPRLSGLLAPNRS